MALIPPHFRNAVVAIGNADANGSVNWVASGFFYGRFREDLGNDLRRYSTFLVSNRHVFAGLTSLLIRANPVGADPAQEIPLDLSDHAGNALWVAHPDPEVDVAVLGIDLKQLQDDGFDVPIYQSEHGLTLAEMNTAGITEGDGVFLLGFPMGLVGGPRSAVVVRGGTMAQLQGAIDGAAKSYLIDGYVFPGNSGGPVVSKPEAVSIQGTQAVGSAWLIGVVAGYIPYPDIALSAQTGKVRVVFEENSGLTNVFPVDAMVAAIDLWDAAHPEQIATHESQQEEVPTVDDQPAGDEPA